MVPRSLHFCFLALAITPSIVFFLASTNAFVLDVCTSFRHGAKSDRKRKPFSFNLAAGGFGKKPEGKPKSAKKKRKKSATRPAPTYTPYHAVQDNLDGSTSQKQAIGTLLSWLVEEEVEGMEGVEIGFSKPNNRNANNVVPGLRGVFAKRDFQAGEYIMAVPFVTTLLVDEDFDSSSKDTGATVLRADEPEMGFLFWKKFLRRGDSDESQKHRAFLECLPNSTKDPNFDDTPDFWSDEDIRRLEIPSVVDKMLYRKRKIAELAGRCFEDRAAEEIGVDDKILLSTIQQCCWLIQSRAFTTYKKAMDLDGNVGLMTRVVLIPFIDMINHASRNLMNAEMQVVETKEYDESFYALVATRPIRKGTEIKICYGTGEETSLDIFSKYGFLPKVENREKEKAALQNILDGVVWSTTLEEDQAMLATEEGNKEPMRTILSIRTYAKSLI